LRSVKVGDKHFRTIWRKPDDERVVQLIDQRFLPHDFVIEEARRVEQMATAIREMHVRGAGLIGASAGYGMYLAALEAARAGRDSFDEHMIRAATQLRATRPTAVNLSWAIERQLQDIATGKTADEKIVLALRTADLIADEDAEHCRMIGQHGLQLIRQIAKTKRNKTVNVLTHCNAGWLAFVDYGSATAPIYAAHDSGLPLHVWVAETRPRNQGSKLLFYVALPSSSIDWKMRDGLKEIPIEQRGADEVKNADGWCDGQQIAVRIAPDESPAANYGFDVTPRELVTGLITERGVCEANEKSIRSLFPEQAS